MIGLVLCGGKSLRMGTDKGLMGNPQPWVLRAMQQLHQMELETFVSINTTQQEAYRAIIATELLIEDSDNFTAKGPILGVLSCFEKQNNNILALACDMPFITTTVLEILLANYHQHPDFDVYLFEKEGNLEPLCGIYTTKGLEKIQDFLQLGNFSMRFFLSKLNVFVLPLAAEFYQDFTNVNSR
jgi:molybdenum cofactor guanylyltransferase